MNLDAIDKFFKQMSNKDLVFSLVRLAHKDSIEIVLMSRIEVSRYEIIKDGNRAIADKVNKMRENILLSNLFDTERKQLIEYEKLKNMKFVLDALKELDLSSIKETKKENEYFNIRKALGEK